MMHTLPVLAAAISNSRCIEPKRGWKEPSILWTTVIAESGRKKTSALRAAMAPLRRLQTAAMREYELAKNEHDAAMLHNSKLT